MARELTQWIRRAIFGLPPPRPELPPAPTAAAPLTMVGAAPLLNPRREEDLTASMWRALHIADEIEQRKASGRDPHPEHAQIVAEAMSAAWAAVGAGKWTTDHVAALQARLGA